MEQTKNVADVAEENWPVGYVTCEIMRTRTNKNHPHGIMSKMKKQIEIWQ